MITLNVAAETYAVLGLGKSGLAAARALLAGGANVIAWDYSEQTRQAAEAAGVQVTVITEQNLKSAKALVMSPGIPHTHPAPHPAAALARKIGVPFLSDIDLLLQACPEARAVGITGTNGKSTTTALIGHILQQAKMPTAVGGNLGTPVLSLPPLGREGVYVLELSSYQLDLLETRRLTVGVLLNITPDHLGRHGGLEGYIAAKEKIANPEQTQTLVIGLDTEPTCVLADRLSQRPNLTLRRVSMQQKLADGLWREGSALKDGAEFILDLAELPRLPGAHNAENVACAYAACKALGLDKNQIIAGIRSFPGLVHRQQLIATINGVRYINDSKANADATSKALVCYDAIYWIVGGKPKEGGLAGLEASMPRIRRAYLIGEAADDFALWLQGRAPATVCQTLEAALQAAHRDAQREPGSVVLLSPACASFDQFRDFEHRGEAFAELVKKLQAGCQNAA